VPGFFYLSSFSLSTFSFLLIPSTFPSFNYLINSKVAAD
jgi:hypothetical protein